MNLPTLQKFQFTFPQLNQCGEIAAQIEGRGTFFTEILKGGVILVMVSIPGGLFHMGSLHPGANAEEAPQHLVSVQNFYFSRGPITQAQWQAVMGRLPSCRFHDPNYPVENVDWHQAREFCRKLARVTGRPYRLPSEAEWEYACRAGTSTPFWTGATITTDQANYVGLHTFKDEAPGIYRHTPNRAGEYPPNPFGLYDLHGNVWEWCADAWHDSYEGASFDGSPRSGSEGKYHPARGGSWHEPPANCRCATRLKLRENERDDFIGFRAALS